MMFNRFNMGDRENMKQSLINQEANQRDYCHEGNMTNMNDLKLKRKLELLEKEKGDAEGMLIILRSNLREANDEIFELQANMATIEAEAKQRERQADVMKSKEISKLQSQNIFMDSQLKQAERSRSQAIRELDSLRKKFVLEEKRKAAEKRLLESRKRNLMASQISSSQSSIQFPNNAKSNICESSQVQITQTGTLSFPSSSLPKTSSSTQTNTEIQVTGNATAPTNVIVNLEYHQENSVLLAEIMSLVSEDFFTLLGIQQMKSCRNAGPHENPSSNPNILSSQGILRSNTNDVYQTLSQMMLQSPDMDNGLDDDIFNLSQHLRSAVIKMIEGSASSLILIPVLVDFLRTTKELKTKVLISALRLLYSLIYFSHRSRLFLVADSIDNSSSSNVSSFLCSSRISHPQIRNIEIKSQHVQDDIHLTIENKPLFLGLKEKLIQAICRLIKNYLGNPQIIQYSISFLFVWCGSCKLFQLEILEPLITNNVIQDVLLSPKSTIENQVSIIKVLSRLIQNPELFIKLQQSAEKSLFFNRCARMLSSSRKDQLYGIVHLRLSLIRLMSQVIVTYSTYGTQFLLDNTRGYVNESDGDKCLLHHLLVMLDRLTFEYRAKCVQLVKELMSDINLRLTRESFLLLSVLCHSINLSLVLPDINIQIFQTLMLWVGQGHINMDDSDRLSKSANVILSMLSTASNSSR